MAQEINEIEKIEKDLELKRQKIEKELEKLHKQKERILYKLNPEISIAEYLHSKLCRWNHTDGCSWHYEKTWEGRAHKDWLKKAEGMMPIIRKYNMSIEDVKEMLKNI